MAKSNYSWKFCGDAESNLSSECFFPARVADAPGEFQDAHEPALGHPTALLLQGGS